MLLPTSQSDSSTARQGAGIWIKPFYPRLSPIPRVCQVHLWARKGHQTAAIGLPPTLLKSLAQCWPRNAALWLNQCNGHTTDSHNLVLGGTNLFIESLCPAHGECFNIDEDIGVYPLFSEKPTPPHPSTRRKGTVYTQTQGLGYPTAGAINYSDGWGEEEGRVGGVEAPKGPPLPTLFNQLEGMRRSTRKDSSSQVSQEALSQAVCRSRTRLLFFLELPHLKARDPIPAAYPENERLVAGEGLGPVSAILAYSDRN